MKRLFSLIIIMPVLGLLPGCGSDTKEDPVEYFMRLNVGEKLVNNPAGSFNVTITSNTSWTIQPQDSWISPERTQGTGEMQVRIGFEANPDLEERTGTVIFTGEGVNPVYLTVKQSDLTFSNPVVESMPDPWIVKVGDYYYACKAGAGPGVSISRSDKLTVVETPVSIWKTPSDQGGIKVWNRSELWAPELHYIDGAWYVYYTAGRPRAETNSYGLQRSGVLRCQDEDPLTGRWEDMGMLFTGDDYVPGIVPTANNTIYAIDLSVFTLNGQMYAVWSGQPSNEDGSQRLYIASMSDPCTISSSRVEISRAEKGWETVSSARVNEGPAFLKNKEKAKFYIIYSANGSWTKQYCLGSLELSDTTANPLTASNWIKSNNHVFYRCDDTASVDGVNGVGHCSFTTSPDGTEDWIIYHTKTRNSSEWGTRAAFIQKFTWNEDGSPNFGVPVGWKEPLELPSGETL